MGLRIDIYVFNSVLIFGSVTHFRLCQLEPQVSGTSGAFGNMSALCRRPRVVAGVPRSTVVFTCPNPLSQPQLFATIIGTNSHSEQRLSPNDSQSCRNCLVCGWVCAQAPRWSCGWVPRCLGLQGYRESDNYLSSTFDVHHRSGGTAFSSLARGLLSGGTARSGPLGGVTLGL